MSATVKRKARVRGKPGYRVLALLFSLFVWVLCAVCVQAAENGQVMSYGRTDDSVVFYIRHPGGDATATAMVGNEPMNVTIEGADSPIPTVTWVLVDNSKSISGNKDRVQQLLLDLIAEKNPNEKINLYTFAEGLHELRKESGSYADLKSSITEITYRDQYTYLADVLQEVWTQEYDEFNKRPRRNEYVRVFVVCDGADNNPRGISLETLISHLKEFNIPVYIVGCGDDNAALRAMANISYNTGAQYWDMWDLNTEVIAAAMRWDELPVKAKVFIPENLRDGVRKQVEITFPDGVRVRTEALMPSDLQPTPVPATQSITLNKSTLSLLPDNQETLIATTNPAGQGILWTSSDASIAEVSPNGAVLAKGFGTAVITASIINSTESAICTVTVSETPTPSMPFWVKILIGVLLALLIVAAAVGVYLYLKNRKTDDIQPVSAPRSAKKREIVVDQTQPMTDDDMDDEEDMPETVPLNGSGAQHMLSLSDLKNSAYSFQAPLRNKVSIGRAPHNQIVIDYDKSVSGSHCEIFVDGSGFKIRDLNSSNGTFVNGSEVSDTATIFDGSVLRLGRAEFKVVIQ